MKIEIGMKVKTKIGKSAYYDAAYIQKGSIGEVGAINCAYVTGRKRGTFTCVDFMRDGQRVRVGYADKEIVLAQV